MYVYDACLSVVVTVWGSVGMCVVQRPLINSVFKPWSVGVCCVFL